MVSRPEPVQDDHFPILDLIRFGAALLVVFGHARGLLLAGIDSVTDQTVLVRGFYLMTGLQHEGVVLFFVVSGFLVGGSAWLRMEAGRFSASSYLTNRFTRIYLVLIPALILVGIVANAGAALFPATRLYAERPLFPSGVSAGWTWDQVPCHLLAVQGLLCEPWGANPPLWSLGYEWVFYLVGPALFAVVLMPMRPAARLIAAAVAILAVLQLQHINAAFLQWFAIWLLGVAAASVGARWRVPVAVGLGGLVLCAGAMVVSRAKLLPPDATDALVAVGLATALACRDLARRKLRSRLIDRGARFSYSLYLIHLPVILFVGALLEAAFGWPPALVQPDLRGVAAFAVLVAIALLSAWAFAAVTEDHTAAVRRRLMKLIAR